MMQRRLLNIALDFIFLRQVMYVETNVIMHENSKSFELKVARAFTNYGGDCSSFVGDD